MPSMASQHRKHRGYRTQRVIAQWLQQWYPHALPVGSGAQGEDITGIPWSVEVKARSDWNPLAWTKQAEKNANDKLPFVIQRCNGQGEDVGSYLAIIRLDRLVALLNERSANIEPTRCTQCGSWMNTMCRTCQIGGINA